MCDYSIQNVKSRPASVGDKLTTYNFGTGTRGFAGVDDCTTAVCVLPGTELAFDQPVNCQPYVNKTVAFTTAIFRQVHKDQTHVHHDCLEFPDGTLVMLTHLVEGQTATVLQLPATPRNAREVAEQKRVEFAG